MSKWLNYFTLCSLNNVSEFLGVAQGKDPDNLLTSVNRNIVLLMKMSNQKQIQSWTVLDRLTSKVVYDGSKDHYVGVFGNSHIRCWKENSKELNKVKKQKLKGCVYDLYQLNDSTIFVIYANGLIEEYNNAIVTRKNDVDMSVETKIFDSTTSFIESVKIYEIENSQTILVTYFIKNKTTASVQLIYFLLTKTDYVLNSSYKRIQLERGNVEAKLLGYTMSRSEKLHNLVTFWSDGLIYSANLESNVNDDVGMFVAPMDFLCTEHKVFAEEICSDYIAVYGSNLDGDGASLVLYSMEYNIVQSKQYFKAHFDNCKFWVNGNRLLMAFGQVLTVITFKISQELLCDLLGSRCYQNLEQHVVTDFIDEEPDINEYINFNDCQYGGQPSSNEQITETKKLNGICYTSDDNNKTLLDQNIINDKIDELQHKLFSFTKIKSFADSSLATEKCKIMLAHNDRAIPFDYDELNVISERMEQLGFSEIQICDQALAMAINNNLPSEVLACLLNYNNKSDKWLVKSLCYALSLPGELTSNQCNGLTNGYKEDEMTMKRLKVKIIEAILTNYINNSTITKYLRSELNIENSIVLMKYIHSVFIDPDISFKGKYNFESTYDCDNVLLNWFIAILDSQYNSFLLTKDSSLLDCLQKWQLTILGVQDNLENMNALSAVLDKLIDGKTIIQKRQYSKWYNVEQLKLY